MSEYGTAVVEGIRSMMGAARRWRANPLVTPVNRRMWGAWWPVTLTLLAAVVLAAEILLPPRAELARRTPLLLPLAFVPSLVRDLLLSAPAVFAYVVVWRVRRLRSSSRDSWPGIAGLEDAGTRFFEAGALPVAVAATLLGLGGLAAQTLQGPSGGSAAEPRGFGTTVLTIALVAGVLGVHRSLGQGFGQLLGAGFFVWGMHLAIGFSVPWMASWWAYLPVVGRFAPQRSAEWALLLFDLAIGCAAWTLAREKCRAAPLWIDPPPPPPPADKDNAP
jgi:hypothetical protein